MRARHLQALVAITVAGGVLRFATLGVQSYWLDEAATVDLMQRGLRSMISGVAGGESTPPLYYCLAWAWAKLFGTGEVGLRSLSALIGTATIPVAYLLGRRVGERLAGVVTAALCAFNPLLVWYSQEARAYALLVLLTGLSLLAMLSVLERPRPSRIGVWALVAIAALATHYFAGFLIGAEAAWILWRLASRRNAVLAIGAVALAAVALLPLALHQRSTGAAMFISASSLLKRTAEVPKQFAIGYHGPAEIPFAIVAGLILAYALFRLAATAPGAERHRGVLLAGMALAAVLAPAVLALIGPDYLLARNVLPAWLPFYVAIGTGLAVPGAAREGVAAASLLCAIGLVLVVAVAADPRYQRDDWRGAARALGPVTQSRVVIVTPVSGRIPLSLYLHGASAVPPEGIDSKEIDLVGLAPRLPGEASVPPRPPVVGLSGFTEFARRQAATYTVVRERSPVGTHITPTVGTSPLDGRPAIALYQPYGPR